MFCSKCGEKIVSNGLFCGQCGVNINNSSGESEKSKINTDDLSAKSLLAEFKNTKATTCLHCGYIGLMGVHELEGKFLSITFLCFTLGILFGYWAESKWAMWIMFIWSLYFSRIRQLHCVKCRNNFQTDVFGRTKKN